MKSNFFSTMLICLMSVITHAQKGGQLVVDIVSITCENQSWDGVVEFDGPGNEVFLSGAFFTRNPRSTSFKIHKDVNTTTTFGSIAGHDERTRAGTASPTGGIANNNAIMVNRTILSTHLDGDGFTLFSPLLWERDDDNETIYNRYKTQILSDLESASLMPFPNFGNGGQAGDPFAGKIYQYGNGYNINIPPASYPSIFNSLVNPNAQGNRPVKITKFSGQALLFDPSIILIEAKNLWAVYNQSPTNHPYPLAAYPFKIIKEISMNFGENTYSIGTSNGRYKVNFAISFAPDNDEAATASQPAQNSGLTQITNTTKTLSYKTSSTIKGNPTPAYTMNNELLYGQWKGIIGANSDAKSSPFLFKINNNVFWLLDNNGASAASGGFKIENNNFTSTYYYPNGDNFTISSLNYNPSTGELSGSWFGNGANANKKGSWLAVKQSN